MEDCIKYAFEIVNSVVKGEIHKISNIIESFLLESTLRQYVNLKKYNMSTKNGYCKEYLEIKEILANFKEILDKYVDDSQKFFYHDEAILALISSNIKPHSLGDSYMWLEQRNFFFKNADFYNISENATKVELILNNIPLYEKYKKLTCLKKLKYYYPPIACEDRYSTTFYYNNAVAIYNWNALDIDSTLRSTLASVGKTLYLSNIVQGDIDNQIELTNLRQDFYSITNSQNILNMPDDLLFSDMFSLYILNSSKFLMTKENLGVIYNFVSFDEKFIMSKVNSFFNSLKLNQNKLKCKSVFTGKEKEVS